MTAKAVRALERRPEKFGRPRPQGRPSAPPQGLKVDLQTRLGGDVPLPSPLPARAPMELPPARIMSAEELPAEVRTAFAASIREFTLGRPVDPAEHSLFAEYRTAEDHAFEALGRFSRNDTSTTLADFRSRLLGLLAPRERDRYADFLLDMACCLRAGVGDSLRSADDLVSLVENSYSDHDQFERLQNVRQIKRSLQSSAVLNAEELGVAARALFDSKGNYLGRLGRIGKAGQALDSRMQRSQNISALFSRG